MKPILVVDDEKIMRESLRDWLTESGYSVETAEEGESALKEIVRQDFGVVIMDLKLPGKDGIEILKEARAKRPYLKGIVITAYPSIPSAVRAVREGAIDFLPKPFSLDELGRLITDVIGPAKEAGTGAEVPLKISDIVAPPEARELVQEVINENTGKVYRAPCQIACPIGEDIQRTNVMLACVPNDAQQAASQLIRIGNELYEKNPLFPICGYVCGLCERQCNYKDQTGAIKRKMLKRFLAESYMSYLDTKPAMPLPSRQKVAVIGGGPGGLMCAYELGKKGYQVTVFERTLQLGGALRNIPQYRLPAKVLNSTLNNMVRIANVDVRYGVDIGGGKKLDDLKNEGYQAVFIATGTPAPRPLTFEGKVVPGGDLDGVALGLHLLYEINQGAALHPLFRRLFSGKKVLVIGGGNVAFDVARTARRLGGEVTIVCLENNDKSTKDGIPADLEEIEGAEKEGITISYSRGVEEIAGENGKFKKIKCPRCTEVFDKNGFNPKFDRSDFIYLEGDVLLVTIGQGSERGLFQKEALLNEKGRLEVDPLTLMSRKEGVFIGGDVKRIGFAAEAMRDGIIAAESIDRYLLGEDMKAGRSKEFEGATLPRLGSYKPQPRLEWALMTDRLSFELFEKGFTLDEAVAEAKRCLHCGPCKSCKACVALGLQSEIPDIEVNQDLCSGCGICIAVCNSEASKLIKVDGRSISTVDPLKCNRCGVCIATCPVEARTGGEVLKTALSSAMAA